MPNHFHGIFFIPDNYDKTINQVIANGKRFIAYEIIKQLKILNQESLLDSLAKKTSIKERLRGKIHKVFISSFDCKLIYNEKMMETKIDYIHHNPVKGKWALVEDYTDYIHSSIAFYEKGENIDFIIHYKDV